MKVLLHICCGPCAIYPVELLRQEGYEIEGFFYNPNIHPCDEYKKRQESVSVLAVHLGLDVVYHRYDPENFLKQVSVIEDRKQHHHLCWQMRLEEAANIAIELGISNFTTTLLSSPYQDIDKIKEIGERIAKERGINFLSRNFKKGFSASRKISKQMALYHQLYCGCVYSQEKRG